MKFSTGAGSAMHLDSTRVQFRLNGRPGGKQSLGTSDIPEIRKLLRTEKSIAEIADVFGVVPNTLRAFIKRRAICDMKARRDFISLKRSVGE